MHRLVYLLLFVALTGFGQGGSGINTHIDNKKTSGHIRIPGTRLYVIPPPGFSIATNFVGLEKNDVGILNVMDLVGGNFYTNAATFNKAEFEKRGIQVLEFREITVNGYPAKFFLGQVPGQTSRMYELVFGDTTFSTLIMTEFKTGDDATAHAIIASLNTICYDKHVKVDPFEVASFTVDDKNLAFKFYRYGANMFVYSIGGVDHSGDPMAPMVMISQLPRQPGSSLKEYVGQALAQGQKYGFKDPKIISEGNPKPNGRDVYETEIEVTLQGDKVHLYYLIAAKGDRVTVVNGVVRKNFDKIIPEFKKLAYSLKLK